MIYALNGKVVIQLFPVFPDFLIRNIPRMDLGRTVSQLVFDSALMNLPTSVRTASEPTNLVAKDSIC